MSRVKKAMAKVFSTIYRFRHFILALLLLQALLISTGSAESAYLYSSGTIGILSELAYIKTLLSQIGPILSAVLFIVAGIFYALGQIMPPDKRANFHTASINIIIGAIIIGVLSVASTSLALASSHLLSNATINAS